MNNFKIFLKVIVFVLIFAIIYSNVFSILWLERNSIYHFFQEKKNTLDIVYIGSSNVFLQFISPLSFNEFGFTTGLLGTYAIPFSSYEFLLRESRNYQTPELYVIDLLTISWSYETDETSIRLVTDSLPNSINRYNAINTLLDESNITDNRLSYYFSFINYHSMWKYLDFDNMFTFQNSFYKGYSLTNINLGIEEQDKIEWIFEDGNLGKNEEVLIHLLEYIKEEDLEVLFTIPSRTYTEEAMQKINRAVSIIEEYGYEVVNFYLEDDLIDYKTDLFNGEHLNIYGSTKFTLYFSEYLVQNYDLPDHRDDSAYSSWALTYEKFKEGYLLLTESNFEELVEAYYEKDY